jgi:hypothetical protein
VKFSIRQILASASGAVLAAVIASLFGVKGTIVGVAIGSAAATFGTTLVAQSIDRGRDAMKQVVVRVPESSTLLRRLGGTKSIGETQAAPTETTAVAEHSSTTASQSDATVAMDASPLAPAADGAITDVVQRSEPVTAEMLGGAMLASADPATAPMPAAAPAAPSDPDTQPVMLHPPQRGMRWPMIAGTAAIVFVLALVFVTAIELIAGRPLTDLLGGHTGSNEPSVGQFVNPSPPKSTSTTTTTTSSSSTTTSSTSTTTTTMPGGTTTSTTPGQTTTTTGFGGVLGNTTTTSSTSTTTTTTVPG